MNQETIKYCAFLKKDEPTWKDLLSTASSLIYGNENNKASEEPARDLLGYYSIPDWDFDLRRFPEEFLLEVDADDVAKIICDAAVGGHEYSEEQKAIDGEIASKRVMFFEIKIGGKRLFKFEGMGGCSMLDASNEPEAA